MWLTIIAIVVIVYFIGNIILTISSISFCKEPFLFIAFLFVGLIIFIQVMCDDAKKDKERIANGPEGS